MSNTDHAVSFLNEQSLPTQIPPELLPAYFEAHPDQARPLVQSTQRMAEIAAQLRQWEALDQAVRFLIACQQAVLQWWENNVLRRGQQISQDRGRFQAAKAETIIGFSDNALSRWRVSLANPAQYEARLHSAARRKAGLEPEPNRVTPNSGENEWFTPAQYIEAARTVMGSIDLDPATHPAAQQTVQATNFFTAQHNGLELSWYGNVWLNPPYAQPWIERFADKLVSELASGAVSQAIMLTNNCTDTKWFHKATEAARLLCFTLGRIRFIGFDGQPSEAPLQGQTFFYYGPNTTAFLTHFSPFGMVLGHA